MTFYSDMADMVNELLDDFGQTVTLRRTVAGTFDATTETESGGSTSDITTTGIQKNYRQDQIDGTRVQHGDRLYILDDDQVPVLSDKVKVGSVYWNIVDIQTVNPAGTPLAYFVQVRA